MLAHMSPTSSILFFNVCIEVADPHVDQPSMSLALTHRVVAGNEMSTSEVQSAQSKTASPSPEPGETVSSVMDGRMQALCSPRDPLNAKEALDETPIGGAAPRASIESTNSTVACTSLHDAAAGGSTRRVVAVSNTSKSREAGGKVARGAHNTTKASGATAAAGKASGGRDGCGYAGDAEAAKDVRADTGTAGGVEAGRGGYSLDFDTSSEDFDDPHTEAHLVPTPPAWCLINPLFGALPLDNLHPENIRPQRSQPLSHAPGHDAAP